MSYIYKNISGDTATEILPISYVEKVTAIKIANARSSGNIIVDLYLYKITEDVSTELEDKGIVDTVKKFYIMRNTTINSGSCLLLEDNEITFNNNLYSLYIKLSTASEEADIIIDAIPISMAIAEPGVILSPPSLHVWTLATCCTPGVTACGLWYPMLGSPSPSGLSGGVYDPQYQAGNELFHQNVGSPSAGYFTKIPGNCIEYIGKVPLSTYPHWNTHIISFNWFNNWADPTKYINCDCVWVGVSDEESTY